MERPLDYLNNLHQNDWFIGYNSRQFHQIAQELYLELTQLSACGTPPKIILAEREPLQFLASFIAACAANCPVFLCNPDWGTQEWQQVFDLVQPDIILGIGNWELGRQCGLLPRGDAKSDGVSPSGATAVIGHGHSSRTPPPPAPLLPYSPIPSSKESSLPQSKLNPVADPAL